MTVTKVGNRWQARFRHETVHYRRVFDTEKEATTWECSIIGDDKRPVRESGLLRDHLREFLNWGENVRGKALSTTRTLNQMLLGNFLPFMERNRVIRTRQLTIKAMREYQEWWLANAPFNSRIKPTNRNHQGMKSTWNMYWQAIHAFCEWGVKRGHVDMQLVPAEEFKLKVKSKPPETFDREEIGKIIAYLETERAPDGISYKAIMIRFLLYTGMRLSEALNLTWREIDLKGMTIKVTSSRKSDESRTIPIVPLLLPHLKALPHSQETLFPPHHKKTWWSDLQRACVLTGIRRRRIHDLRHTCARYLIEAGTDLVLVQRILGHKDIRTTQRYAQHFDLDRAKDALEKAFSRIA